VQPPISPEELNQVPKIVRANSRWQDAMKKRGVTNFEGVMIDPWAPGTLYPSENPKNRWVRALSYMKDTNINGYARPIEGVVAVVNMNTRKVDRIIDYGQHPIPPKISDLNEKAVEKSLGKLREAPKPLKIEQPKGPSFELSGANGQEVVWQKWHFRFTVHPRDGLTLYQVGYEDRGHIRPILYKASLSEMVVPYGESDEGWIFRNAFDVGEYGIGRLTDSMDAGVEAPENAKFFDLTFSDDFGAPFTTPRGVALFERDGGLMWKHFEFYNNSSDARRARELVLMNVVTVGNYDYGFQWIFRQDGSLELQAMLTGIMLAKGVDAKSVDDPAAKGLAHAGHWHLVAPYVACPHHQHFFNFRIDWDVDGENNSVSELNVKSLPPGPKNKAANAFIMEHKIFKTEKEAQRELNLDSNRKWIVTNTTEKDSLGYNTGYALLPGDSTRPYISPQSKVRRRAGFIDHHVWVTPYKEDEQHAAGEYPNQSVGAQGLALWTKADRKIEDTDLVMWYTFGVTHTPRPEEWPVMPVTTAGFKLVPVGFFSQNPAMDLPVTK
jgi:primary-amine oxidase